MIGNLKPKAEGPGPTVLPDGHLPISRRYVQKDGGARRRRLNSRSIGFLYTALRRRRPSQPSPTSAEPSSVSEAGSGTTVCVSAIVP